MLKRYKNKKVLIAGFGVEGKATFDFLRTKGILADIADVHTPVIPAEAGIQKNTPKIITGEDYLSSVQDYDVVFRTPGISPLTSEIRVAREKGIDITSQISLFMNLCPCKTIGVTGTKGKGTTSSLIYEILKTSGEDVYLGGNIGVPAIFFLKKLKEKSIVILELSSFQLMDLKKSPNIAVVLNVTQDHLDYHKNREEYVEAKKSIVSYQTPDDFAVINTDYEAPKRFQKETKGEVYEVSTQGSVQKGCYVNKKDEIILSMKDIEEEISSFSELQIRGRHNLENVCAAVVSSYLAGADIGSIKKAIKGFKGLEHRLELVAEIDGIKYYNDSFATTPETTIAAINSFHEPVVLIAGGSEKGSDYTQMGKVAAKKVKTVFLMGDTAEEIKEKILSVGSDIDIQEGFIDMDDLVKRASDAAESGDAVVLSPGCASFGLFENYKQRGDLFKKAVRNLRI